MPPGRTFASLLTDAELVTETGTAPGVILTEVAAGRATGENAVVLAFVARATLTEDASDVAETEPGDVDTLEGETALTVRVPTGATARAAWATDGYGLLEDDIGDVAAATREV
jgi:hypothetical protein